MSEDANILALLTSDDPDSIREGARQAGKHQLIDAVPVLVQHIGSSNIGVQEAADRGLRKIGGTEVVHGLIPLLRSDDAPVRNVAMDILRGQAHIAMADIIALLHDTDADIRIFAADILGSTNAAQAVAPLCTALLHDPEVNVRYQAAVSLGELARPEATPCLGKAMGDEEWVQFSVIEALTKIRAEASVGALIGALDKSTDLVASIIVDALAEIGNIKAAPLLLRHLESSPTPLCNKIVRAIIKIVGGGSLALLGDKNCARLREYMHTAITDEDQDIQDAVVEGFAALGGEDASAAVLKLAATLTPDTETDRLEGMERVLGQIGYSAALEQAVLKGDENLVFIAAHSFFHIEHPKVIPLLAGVFWNNSRDVQRSLILVIAQHADTQHQDFFVDILARHPDGNILRVALSWLGSKGEAEKVEAPIIAMLDHPYNDVKESAIEAAIALGTPTVIAYFCSLAKQEQDIHRMMAAYALGFFGPDTYLAELAAAAYDPSPEVRKVAVDALGKGCPLPYDRAALIAEKMQDTDRDVRMAAISASGNCLDPVVEPSLIQGLKDVDPWICIRSAERLGDMKGKEAIPYLVDKLEDSNRLVVIKIIELIGSIGGESAFRSLMPLLNHEDTEVQQAAEEALDAIRRQAGE